MRRVFALVCICLLPGAAFAQGNNSVVGFGGFSLNGSVNGFDSHSASIGGAVTFTLTPGLQAVGEVGHLGNVLPTTADTLFSLGQTGLGVSAFYGEGGIRVIAPTGSFAPYGEATAGFARLNITDSYLGGYGNILSNLALGFVDRTTPIASVGGGLVVRGGPVVFDVGYRYKKLFADQVLQDVLGFGQPLHASEVRAGVGVRF